MQNYHKHSWFTNVLVADCPTSYEAYIERARELGHKVISSVEHGFQSNYYVPYELVEKNNEKVRKEYENGLLTKEEYERGLLKFVFGTEAYWVKDRHEKDMTNSHIILLAKNEEGRRDINEALSDANIDGYYKQPRVDMELLMRIKPENVMVTTACIAYWKYDDIEDITAQLHNHFGDNFFLEVQCHNTEEQKQLNKRILELSNKLGIDIIFGYDSHYIYEDDFVERDNYISTRRKNYQKDDDEENGWYMDYPDDETVRNRLRVQGILSEEQIERCMKNTDIILEFDDLYFDKEIKLPTSDLDMTQAEKDEELRRLVYSKWNAIKNTVDESRWGEYEEGIEYELNAIIDTHMTDYFLIDYKIVQKGIQKGGIITKTGRGSGVSYYVNSLLGFSNIDRFISPVKLYPDRFMSKTRILQTKSLPDLDLNLGNPEVFAVAQDEVMTEIYGDSGHAYPMISYKPLKASSAFKLYAKSQGLDFEIANSVTQEIAAYEKALKHADSPEDKESIDIYDFVDAKYHHYLDESKKYRGIINAKSQAPCGYLIYAGNIKREIGLIRCVSGNADDDKASQKSVITTVIDGSVAENYKFVKNDLLKVDVWLTINNVFNKIGIPVPTVPEMTKLIENDSKVWDLYAKGFTMGINQFESDFARNCCMQYKPKNMQELTALVSALRPGFKTQLSNFLARKPYTNGIKELDNLLKDSFHYIMYQENCMTYLGWLGIEQTETYDIIKKISKKKFKEAELANLQSRLLKSWVSHVSTEDGFQKTWDIIEAFAKYAFNASHAYSYAYDSIYGAYLKAHYPYEFYSEMMQYLSAKGEKDKVIAYKKEMQQAFGIKNGDYRFRLDNREFSIDKEHKYINPSLLSVKGFSNKIADYLYSLKDNHYDSFIDLLLELRQNGIAETRISELIKINYFNEFGNIKYLEKFFEIFKMFYSDSSKRFLTQYKKDKAYEQGIDFDLLRRHCDNEATSTFMKINTRAIIDEIMKEYEDIETSDKEVIQYRYHTLDYLDIIDKKYSGYCVVTDLNVDYSPKIKLYALANGNEIPVKMKKDLFKQNPLKRGDIIQVLEQHQDFKRRMVNGEWTKSTEKEWWVDKYKIC